MAPKVWKRVLEMFCGLNDLLCSSQVSPLNLFTHATHADSIRMSVVACRVNLFTRTTHADSIRMTVVACRVNLFTYATHADSIRMSVVACRVKIAVTYTMYTYNKYVYIERTRQRKSTSVGLTQACPNKILSTK